MKKHRIRWPEWVLHENDAANVKEVFPLLTDVFTRPDEYYEERVMRVRAWRLARNALITAMEIVRNKTFGEERYSSDIVEYAGWAYWQLASVRDRRDAWRRAMEMLGYTEVCDA